MNGVVICHVCGEEVCELCGVCHNCEDRRKDDADEEGE